VKGWYSGIAIDSEDTFAFSKLYGIRSTNEIFPLEKAQAAYDRMMSGEARFRVVLGVRNRRRNAESHWFTRTWPNVGFVSSGCSKIQHSRRPRRPETSPEAPTRERSQIMVMNRRTFSSLHLAP
jgi:hypothetical protein